MGADDIMAISTRACSPNLTCLRDNLAAWRADYNQDRPHSRLDWLSPAQYAATFNLKRDPALRSMGSSAPAPAAIPNPNTNRQSLHHAG